MTVLAKLLTHDGIPAARDLARLRHLLIVAPAGTPLQQLPLHATLGQALQRRRKKAADLAKAPLAAETADGALAVWVLPDPRQTVFEQHTLLRKALAPLLAEAPELIGIAVLGPAAARRLLGERAAYVASVNGVQLPQRKKAPAAKPLQRIELWGGVAPQSLAPLRAVAEGNTLCRTLTVTAPNELTPREYRRRLRVMARGQGWGIEEYDFSRLKRMGAGAFCAVAQGSDEKDAAIVRLRYRPRGAKRTVALVGKGICFDTGGHNLKPARYMQGMHEDMNGSAVALGILHAATQAGLPVNIDCWLALAQNHLSPRAYKQNDIVTALNGTTIEVVHTDAEGRMVLADTLTLAARAKPSLIVDFATLTGSMHVAVGTRYSGFFASEEGLAARALRAGVVAGERLCRFPMDEDYDSALDSEVADVKQCTLDSDADHILAARLLQRFTGKTPWIHMDLSAHGCKGGLGAVASDCTGFGVALGFEFLRAR
ncbi:MAG: leucyl aminopeptidase family protein [Betaproteobacteria bacterium]|nr:leucyl aminopeptidase family protein [Betaproteobacteria bacterium]